VSGVSDHSRRGNVPFYRKPWDIGNRIRDLTETLTRKLIPAEIKIRAGYIYLENK
jgi:hypothetical protein